MPAFGVYPIADAQVAGTEESSTYEGRHVTVLESDLIHPTHADGFVDKGDPVVFGTTGLRAVGVAFNSAAAATDYIALDTEGIWILDVVAADDSGNVAVAGGDTLYINTSTAVVSKIATAATQIPFGYALGVISSGSTEAIAVKVHYDPQQLWILDDADMQFGDDQEASLTHDSADDQGKLRVDIALAAGAMDDGYGAWEVNLNETGAWTGHSAAASAWVNVASGVTYVAGNYMCARNDGIYEDSGATITNVKTIVHRMQLILGDTDSLRFPWSINTGNQQVTAWIDCNNHSDLGLLTDAGSDSGDLIPYARNAAGVLKYFKVYDHS